MHRRIAPLPLALCLGACSAAPEPAGIAAPTPAKTAPVAPDPRAGRVGVASIDAAPDAVIDGDLTEWGAPSKIGFALSGQQAWIVGRLAPAASEGVWVGVGARFVELPVIGHDLAAERASHVARFERLYRIDPTGVRALGKDGALSAIEGAKAAWKREDAGVSLEVSLPLSALPRFAEAPIERVRLTAAIGRSAPDVPPERWVWFDLASPVHFQPYDALRMHAIERALDRRPFTDLPTPSFEEPFPVSYQPGDPLHIEVIDAPSCDRLERHERPLFEPLAPFGDLQIVRAAAPHRGPGSEGDGRCTFADEPWLAVLDKEAVKSIVRMTGTLQTTFRRGDELHVLSYEERSSEAIPGVFRVIGFSATGAHNGVPVQILPGYAPLLSLEKGPSTWTDLETFLGGDKDSFAFGWRGVRSGRGFEATWRWDPIGHQYRGIQRFISLPIHKGSKPTDDKAPLGTPSIK